MGLGRIGGGESSLLDLDDLVEEIGVPLLEPFAVFVHRHIFRRRSAEVGALSVAASRRNVAIGGVNGEEREREREREGFRRRTGGGLKYEMVYYGLAPEFQLISVFASSWFTFFSIFLPGGGLRGERKLGMYTEIGPSRPKLSSS